MDARQKIAGVTRQAWISSKEHRESEKCVFCPHNESILQIELTRRFLPKSCRDCSPNSPQSGAVGNRLFFLSTIHHPR